jgi:hypothetical protein
MKYFDPKLYSEQQIGPFWFKKLAFKEWFRLVKAEELTKVRRMIKKGVNVNLKDQEGKTAFDHALKNHDLMTMILLIKRGAFIQFSTEDAQLEFSHEVSELDFKKKEILIRALEEMNQGLGIFLRNHAH